MNKMLHVAVAIGVLTFFSTVSAEWTKTALVKEVDSLAELITDIEKRINATVNARIDDNIGRLDECWRQKTSIYVNQIQNEFNQNLKALKEILLNYEQSIPSMDSKGIDDLVQKWYVSSGGLLEEVETAVGDFNQKVQRIHRTVNGLNAVDCPKN